MRRLIDVIDQILPHIPQGYLLSGMISLRSSAVYASPEAMNEHWITGAGCGTEGKRGRR